MYLITNPAINPTIGRYPGITGGEAPLQLLLANIIILVLGVGGALSFLLLLWGAIEYITAGGDKEATQKATKRISSAIIGVVILLTSFAIIYVVGKIFGINLLEFSIPTLS